MATNRTGNAPTILYSNAGSAISSGDVVVMGAANNVTVGVALVDIAATSGTGHVAIEGEFSIAKVDAAVITMGESVMWDSSASKVDDNAATPASGDVSHFGIATETKGSTTSESIKVKLLPGNGTIT